MPIDVADIPKAELHCHLDGILDPAMLRELREEGIDLSVDEGALEAAYPVRDFESFFAWGASHASLDGRLDLYQHIARHHIQRLRAQTVVYAELFVASGELSLDPSLAVDQLAAFREAVTTYGAGEIQVELLIAWGRNRGLDRAQQICTRNLRLFDAGLICGVSLAGPEVGFPVAPLAPVFDRYHAAGVPIQIHAVEWCGPESAWDALAHGHPSRLGHGTHVLDDPRLVETLLARRIHVEMCPTSNLCTGSIARIEDHPIRRALDAGMDVSVATDDPGAFRCSMTSEHALLAERFGFTRDELLRLGANAVRARFQPTLRVAPAEALALA
ncbi:MAG: Adenosine deaminase [uncultured Chloroflexi bacterium]|uniref:adenosine deaminase n=1 Tax=uncultured Chloroflexota bacterium TaxID=166587 RepID=A0A6J4HA77_9CHLR|nr:MAG: Adenosine deaminase [uncultured Chloroflexota bacterium]